MEIRVHGTKVEIAMLEESIDKSGLFNETHASRVWDAPVEGGFTKRIFYDMKTPLADEKKASGFMNIPNSIDEELPFN